MSKDHRWQKNTYWEHWEYVNDFGRTVATIEELDECQGIEVNFKYVVMIMMAM